MIAILLATYNGEKYIKEMLESLEEQTFKDFVCYIHDDGSKDSTLAILNKWIAEHDNGKYVLIDSPPKGGAKNNFLFMLESQEADFYMFADQDDVWLPEKIELTYKAMQGHQVDNAIYGGLKNIRGNVESDGAGYIDIPTCVFTDMYVTDSDLGAISPSFIRYMTQDPNDLRYQRLLIDNMAAGCTIMINKVLRDIAIKPIDWDLVEMHDRYIAILAAIHGRLICIDKPLVYYRQHEGNERGAQTETIMQRVARNISDLVSGNFLKNKREFREYGKVLSRAILQNETPLPDKVRLTLTDLANIDSKSKISRMYFYKKNGLNRAHRNLWFLLWV